MLFDGLADENISVDMIIQSYARKVLNTNDIAFTIENADLDKAKQVLSNLKGDLGYSSIYVDDKIAKVSIIGAGMIDRPGIAAKMFRTLANIGVNIKMIATSEIKVSCLIDAERANEAITALHSVFGLDSDEIADVKGDLPNV